MPFPGRTLIGKTQGDIQRECYFLYRKYSLDRDVEPDVYDIDVVSLGTRVKF